MLAQDLVNEVTCEDFVDKTQLLHGWICTLDNKVFINNNKGWIFPSKQQAQKAFYNSIKWKTNRTVYRRTSNTYWSIQNPDLRALTSEEQNILRDWRAFKKDLINNHNLQFRQL